MYTKNLIQQKIEEIEDINSLRDYIKYLYENYTIHHACFGLNDYMKPCELDRGYMSVSREFDNLDECLGSIDSRNDCVFIESTPTKDDNGKHILNERFVLGKRSNVLSECNMDGEVIDLMNLNKIN